MNENQFSQLYGLSDEELKTQNVIPFVSDSKPGFPCRIGLKDAEPGERLLLINYKPKARMSWMQRLKRVFTIDIETCPECSGKLRVLRVRNQ